MFGKQNVMGRAAFAPVEREDVTTFAPGQEAERWRCGDFLLTHGDGTFARLIHFGQRLRFHKAADRPFTNWNHAALVVSEDGDLVEALGRGVCRTHASKYRPREYKLVHISAAKEDREQAVAFAEWAARNHAEYGWTIIVSIALTLLTGAKFSFFVDGEFICSGLVARALERTGAIFNRTPGHITPADLAKYYEVT